MIRASRKRLAVLIGLMLVLTLLPCLYTAVLSNYSTRLNVATQFKYQSDGEDKEGKGFSAVGGGDRLARRESGSDVERNFTMRRSGNTMRNTGCSPDASALISCHHGGHTRNVRARTIIAVYILFYNAAVLNRGHRLPAIYKITTLLFFVLSSSRKSICLFVRCRSLD